jgi:hypothetical protein
MGRVIPLTVQNAEIKTASVELKTLTVSGKQVTLAVFRQLREEELINYDGTLNGVAWGVVNYCPQGAGKCLHRAHWHVVWQSGTDLLRDTVEKAADFGVSLSSENLSKTWICGALARLGSGVTPGKIFDRSYWYMNEYIVREHPSGVRIQVHLPPELSNLVNHIRSNTDQESPGAAKAKAWYKAEGYTDPDQVKSWQAGAAAEIDLEITRRLRHIDARKAIASLPQLFIAV